MGNLWYRFVARKNNIALIGLDNAGKTTITNFLTNAPYNTTTIPTVGFNVEVLTLPGRKITIFDLGGQQAIRKLWPLFSSSMDGIVFVVDGSDIDRLEIARHELIKILKLEKLRNRPFIILVNKQDMDSAVNAIELKTLWRLRGGEYVDTIGTDGTGVFVAFDKLLQKL